MATRDVTGDKAAPAMDDFHEAMRAASVTALWERAERPDTGPEAPHIWQWETMESLIDQAIAATSMDDAERRVLVLSNPAYAGKGLDCASLNLSVNLQVLMPGESARPHRHTMAALRFFLEGDGAVTDVDGKSCPMEPGDMILTPGWTWHSHVHNGSQRAVWVDALDVPLHVHHGTGVFEPGPAHDVPNLAADSAFAGAGLAPCLEPDLAGGEKSYSPMFRYTWDAARQTLESMQAAPDGSRRLRYTNPVTGGPIMATLDCYLLALSGGQETRPYRSTGNSVCVAVDGDGVSTLGDETIAWKKNDVFTLPAGHWIGHKGSSADATLFEITDREVLRRLDMLREEFRDG